MNTNSSVYSDFSDYQKFASHQRLNKQEMFDDQFMNFMKWFKQDVHQTYTRQDFQKIELRNLAILAIGYLVILLPLYLYLHWQFPQSALVWGVPLFGLAMFFAKNGEVMHMRTHSPKKLTGIGWLDHVVDYLGLAVSGISPNLFARRHLAAHYNDIGIVSKVFSQVWLTFDRFPLSFYSRPQILVKFLRDKEFCSEEKLNHKTLSIETIAFYVYLVGVVTELCFGSYFLFVFHLLPNLCIASCQIVSAMIVHSSTDNRNSFESNGIFDSQTAKGLFRVPLWFYGLSNNGFFVNHGIHHAYPQVPLNIINANYQRYHHKILNDYTGVRYNQTNSHRIYEPLLANLNSPNWFDYGVSAIISLVAWMAMMLTIMGLPIPPTIFELALVDYRVLTTYSKSERFACWVNFFERLNLEERYKAIENRNTYLEWVYGKYIERKNYLTQHPVPENSVVNASVS
ncbi:MAG: hypothetical protein ACRC2S_06405 [Waterburya sp.]